jgi:hypothetical protein
MNGRVYDYNVGRFLSVDPYIQGSGSQGINPYSYIMNNPLAGTDPSGYSISCDPGGEAICGPFGYGDNCSYCVSAGGEQQSSNGSEEVVTKAFNDMARTEITEIGGDVMTITQGPIKYPNAANGNDQVGGESTFGNALGGLFNSILSSFGSGGGHGSPEEEYRLKNSKFGVGPGCAVEGNCISKGNLQNMSSVASLVGTVSPGPLVVEAALFQGTQRAVIRTPYANATSSTPLLPAPSMVKHHIFNVFRGSSTRSQKYREFFKKHGIVLDNHTVQISASFHTKVVHRAGNNWTTRWKTWIDKNPNATTTQVYQQAGKMMDDYGINHLPIVPYR